MSINWLKPLIHGVSQAYTKRYRGKDKGIPMQFWCKEDGDWNEKMWCDFRLLTLAHGWSVIEIKCWFIAVPFSLEATHTSDSSFFLYFDKILKWWYFLKLSIFSNVFNINSDFVIAINSMILLLKIGTSEYHCAKIPSLVKMWDLHEASNRKWFLCPALRWNFSSESYVLEVAKVDDKRRVNLPRWNLLNTAK